MMYCHLLATVSYSDVILSDVMKLSLLYYITYSVASAFLEWEIWIGTQTGIM